MSKFNTSNSQKNRIINKAGGEAFAQSPQLELVSILLTSFVNAKYYTEESEEVNRLIQLVANSSDKKFIAKAGLLARNQYGMRSISHVLAGELACVAKGECWTKSFFEKIVRRPDDITEILAYYLSNYRKPIPNAMKKGLARAFDKFDDYQIAKYRKSDKMVSLVDAVNLLHPTPTKKNSEALRKLVRGTLRQSRTWENQLSAAGSTDTAKKKVWENLLNTRTIGYFALLRNLRNITEQAPESIDAAIAMLVDPALVKKSLVLPFRYLKATQALQETNNPRIRDLLVAIDKATTISLDNVPRLEGSTLIALDSSGSMQGQPWDIGSLFASVLYKTNNADLLLFSDDATYVSLNPTDSLSSMVTTLTQKMEVGGTNFHSIFETANRPYDRIIILSDMQGWMGHDAPTKKFAAYKRRLQTNPPIFSWDLRGYGSTQLPKRNIYCMAGWSEKVFDLIQMQEKGPCGILAEVEKVEL